MGVVPEINLFVVACWIILCRDTPSYTQTCLPCLCRTSVSALRCSWLPSPTTSRSHTSRTLTTRRVTPTVGRRSRQCSTCLTYMQTLSITSSMSVSSATHSPPYTVYRFIVPRRNYFSNGCLKAMPHVVVTIL